MSERGREPYPIQWNAPATGTAQPAWAGPRPDAQLDAPAGQATPESVVSGWLQSPGHCANIMNPALRELGVGYAYNGNSTYRHYWVQDFGTR